MTGAGFSYVQARIQARHGRRPDDSDWSRLESCESAHAYLEAARTGVLAVWAEGLNAEDGIHRLEASLRRSWRHYVQQVASWAPEPWRDAIEWCGCLPDVPTAAHIVVAEEPPEWLVADGGTEAEAPGSLDEWREWWCARMPSTDSDEQAGLAALEKAVDDWIAENRDPEQASVSRAASLHERLEHRVTTVFRRHALGPAAVFAHLLLTALDVQRFRGGLVRRQALSGRGVAGAAA
ncbi:hypothetical protein [Lentisalinibacter salinarum]|uniref:hypothetical protein n=1 Tax=Lentisalinibacter salinarum TaxID=2992239 RepID=UPI00386D8E06